MAILFEELFAADLSGLSGESDADGDFNWSALAAMGPATGGGCAVTIDDANVTLGFGSFTALGAGTAACSGRWWLDPNALTMGNNEEFDALRISNGGSSGIVALARLHKNAGLYSLRCLGVNDAGVAAGDLVNISDGPHWVNVVVVKGTGAGTVTWYIDNPDTPVAQQTGLDNDTHFALVSRIEGGMIAGHDAGTSGIYYTTAWKFSNDTTVWGGEDASAPVITVPGAQTGIVGTQLSVTGVSAADAETNLATIRVRHSGAGTCTVTLSGTSVSAGTNGTNDFTLSGTQANLNTAIGTLKADHAESHPTRSFSTTITITATDDEALSDEETIACTWGIPTGVGTRAIKLIPGSGDADDVIAALSTIVWTPTAAFEGTTQVSMYSKTSTPLDDTDTFDIVVSAAVVTEMVVTGNDNLIDHGSTEPTIANHTDFGSAAINEDTVDRVFTIVNVGEANLVLDGDPIVALSGDGAAAFSVTVQPASPIEPAAEDTFTIRFTPDATDTFEAVVSIDNGTAQDPFTFAITGAGTVDVSVRSGIAATQQRKRIIRERRTLVRRFP